MAPGPDLPSLIAIVLDEASGEDPLDQLVVARRLVLELEAAADDLVGHFVERCRESGLTWSEISSALGVTKQAAHRRYAAASGAPAIPRRPAADLAAQGLEREFATWCFAAVREIERLGFHPGGWIGLMQRLGATGAAHQLLQSGRGRVLPVFHFLVGAGRSELSLEYAVLQPDWAELFTEGEVDTARSRLIAAGVELQ